MIDVVFHPSQLDRSLLARSQVVVLDILRASSTIVTALANGAREVRLFGDIDGARIARSTLPPPALLGGERHCVRIDGFDLANSPREYATEKVGNSVICMTTTNGTAAAVAAYGAHQLLVGSLLNATATAGALLNEINSIDTLLLCAGTDDGFSQEDVLGAGAIIWQILQQTYRTDLPFTDSAWIAYHAFGHARQRLAAALRLGQGGLNLLNHGLEDDIDDCAKLDSRPIAVHINNELIAIKMDDHLTTING